MATAKQLAANRANAKKSTGKHTTRPSGVGDGLTGQLFVIPPEERAAYRAFSQKLTASLNPVGPEELRVAARIVRATWRLHRLAAAEQDVYARGRVEQESDPGSHLAALVSELLPGVSDPAAARQFRIAVADALTFRARGHEFARAALVELQLQRALHKDCALLHHLQTEHNRPHATSVRSAWKPREFYNPPAESDTSSPSASPIGFVISFFPKRRRGLPPGTDPEPQIADPTNPHISPRPKRRRPAVPEPVRTC